MKGLIFNIQRFSIHDGPGIRTTVFLKGCPLDCPWCSNPESKSRTPQIMYTPTACIECGSCVASCPHQAIKLTSKKFIRDVQRCTLCLSCVSACPTHALTVEGKWYSVEEVLNEIGKDNAFYEKSGGGVTLSGGEPLLQQDFTRSLLTALKEHGYHTNIETTGYTSPAYFERILPYLDLVYMDFKHPDNTTHRAVLDVDNDIIISNMKRVIDSGTPLVVRIPVIPRFNHSPNIAKNYVDILTKIHAVDVHLLPFHQMGAGKWHTLGIPYEYDGDKSMQEEELEEMATIFSSAGFNVQISGS